MDTQVLEKIGLTKGESSVYLALIKTGQSSIGPLVTEAKVSRSKIYEIMQRLLEKGLVSSLTENGVKKFKAIDPRLIPDYLEKQKEEIEKQKQDFTNIIPTLLAQIQLKEPSQSVEVFEGWSGMKNVFFKLLKDVKKGDEWYVFGIPKVQMHKREIFFTHWRKESDRIGLVVYLIANEEIRDSKELAPSSKNSRIRYINEQTPTSVEVFKDNTLVGVWTEKPIVILIKSKETADSFKKYFDNMWKIAKP